VAIAKNTFLKEGHSLYVILATSISQAFWLYLHVNTSQTWHKCFTLPNILLQMR